MKKLMTVLGVMLLVGFMAYPVFARGGWGYGGGPGYCWRDRGDNALEQKFFDETATLRNNILSKRNEMTVLLNGENPDRAKLKALQEEINGLENRMAEKRLEYRLESRNAAPGNTYGRGCGRGMGGYGGHGGYGHRGGYGPGFCWN